MAGDLADTLSREGMYAKTITIKIRYHDFDTRTKSRTIEKPRSDLPAIRAAAWQLFSELSDGRPVRLVGLKLSGLKARDLKQKRIDDFF